MAITVDIQVTGAAKALAVTKKIESTLANPAPLLRALDLLLKQQVRETFTHKRDPVTGKAWRPTSAATLEVRPSGGGGTMYATGALQRNILGRSTLAVGNSLRIGTDLIYGVALQGSGKPRFTILPKTAKNLTQPLTREAARAGSARRWCNEHAGFWFIRHDIIFLKTTAGIVPSWKLMKRLDLWTRPFLGVGKVYGKQIEVVTVRFIGMGIKS